MSNETFLRRKDAEEWALEVERRIDRGELAIARSSRDAKTFGDLVKLHREDLQEVGKRIVDLPRICGERFQVYAACLSN